MEKRIYKDIYYHFNTFTGEFFKRDMCFIEHIAKDYSTCDDILISLKGHFNARNK